MPLDRLGRDISYLRISLTDRCNLRCVCCRPAMAPQPEPTEEWLTARQIAAVVQAAVRNGFHKFRLTGGEPTLRRDLVKIVERLAAIDGVSDLAMTTNGLLLPRLARRLQAAGLKRVNIHVDTLDRRRVRRARRSGSLEQVLAGVEAAGAAGLTPVKLNCTVTRGYNDREVVGLARLTLEQPWHVRFIELMPLGNGQRRRSALSRYVPTAETRDRIEAELGRLAPILPSDPCAAAREYRLPGASGVVGFISPVSQPYCRTCTRLRLTADGRFHPCLLTDDELEVKPALRNGGNPEFLDRLLRQAVAAKPTGHRLHEGLSARAREMFQIGG